MREQARLLVLDDDERDAKELSTILDPAYDVHVSPGGRAGFDALVDAEPALVLLAATGDGGAALELLRAVARDPRTRSVPVILVTAADADIDEAEGFALGAVDFITQPLKAAVVRARVRTHLSLRDQAQHLEDLVDERTRELELTRVEVIRKLGRAAEYKNDQAGLGVLAMSQYVGIIAREAGLSDEVVEVYRNAAPMHDVGKIGIPDAIVQKPGKLTQEEFEIMKGHTTIGADIIGASDHALMATAREMALTHHERWNGTGYPYGLVGEAIPLSGRISAIADVFDALTARRPYKDPWPVERAVEAIESERGTQFDPEVVRCFTRALPDILAVKGSQDALSELSNLNLG